MSGVTGYTAATYIWVRAIMKHKRLRPRHPPATVCGCRTARALRVVREEIEGYRLANVHRLVDLVDDGECR